MNKSDKETTDTRTPAQKARDTILSKYGEDYYSKIGKVSGAKSNNRPFRDNPEAARKAVNSRWKKYYADK